MAETLRPKHVRRRIGYRPHRLMTIDLVDPDRLRQELAIRKIACEVPDCTDQAVGVMMAGLPAFLCETHNESKSRPRSAKALSMAIRCKLTLAMQDVASLAYEEAGETVAIVLIEGDLLENARKALSAYDKLETEYKRRKEAERNAAREAANILRKERAKERLKQKRELKNNPVLSDLKDDNNLDDESIDLFDL